MKRDQAKLTFILVYYFCYLAYLWLAIDFENEWWHWLTLVALPFMGLVQFGRKPSEGEGWRAILVESGISKEHWKRGLILAIACGVALGAAQAFFSRERVMIWQYVSGGKVLYAFPMAMVLMMVTAGFTEEFFFRGLLQTQLKKAFGSRVAAIAGGSVLFGAYHFPYAYLKSSWPSHGNVSSAITGGVVPAIVIGIIVGTVFDRSRNLLAPVLVHSCINAVWAMTMF